MLFLLLSVYTLCVDMHTEYIYHIESLDMLLTLRFIICSVLIINTKLYHSSSLISSHHIQIDINDIYITHAHIILYYFLYSSSSLLSHHELGSGILSLSAYIDIYMDAIA
jgi:hypothetical protein